jgi:hypothetical protein
MKTFLVQLEKFDSLSSVREKMRWAKGGRILLIWPRRGKFALSAPELEVLRREAGGVGGEIAIVSQDPSICEAADALGISVFDSVPKAQQSRWNKEIQSFKREFSEKNIEVLKRGTELRVKRTNKPEKIVHWAAVAISALAILSLVLFFLPSATITIHPEIQTKNIAIDVWASPEITAVNINGSLPAKVEAVRLTESASAQSSGKTGLPDKTASGEVVFTNISGTTIEVPKGTVVTSADNSDVRFLTEEAVTVASGEVSSPVPIEAEKSGTPGNLDAGMITRIDGQLGVALEVVNDAPTSGGTDVEAPSPSEEDYQKLKTEMLSRMREEVIAQFQTGDRQMIEKTLDQGTVISEVRSVDVGTASDTFSLTLTVEFTGLTFSNSDLNSLVDDAMNASLESGQTLYSTVSITDQSKTSGSLEEGARWTVTASAETGTAVDANVVIQSVTGKTVNEAISLIDTVYPVSEATSIQTFPAAWKWMPWLSLNTHVEVR